MAPCWRLSRVGERFARQLQARLQSLARDESPLADAVRQEFASHLGSESAASRNTRAGHSELHRSALQAARQAVLAMRGNNEIGDDAFHEIEEELDWLEMAGGTRTE